ncbi:PREDICTED: uncharacterized protein LOC108359348 [Rhagoletis zephyria]|uniref:uncharacterized protein LOC108359348 n=1 Tax=Rhagoletis zephyria TaxID=28612 RepID=UPI000811313A|nr:PREDICTED: uncharacterized protein LOC108359348 [Rhagoletis zephyria]
MAGNKNEDTSTNCAAGNSSGGGGTTSSSGDTKSKATNPFFIFLHEFRQNLAKRGAIKQMTAKQIACAAGSRWRQMSPDEKLTYVVWARKNQQQLDPRLRLASSKSQQQQHHHGSSKSGEGKSKRDGGGTYRGGVTRPRRGSMKKRRPSYIK